MGSGSGGSGKGRPIRVNVPDVNVRVPDVDVRVPRVNVKVPRVNVDVKGPAPGPKGEPSRNEVSCLDFLSSKSIFGASKH